MCEYIIRDKYIRLAYQVKVNEALTEEEKTEKIKALTNDMNAELVDLEASDDNVLIVYKAHKEDIGKGVVVMKKEMAEELGFVEGLPILVKNGEKVIERNIKFEATPELNPVVILLDKTDRDKLGVNEGDVVRISIPTVPDPEVPN